MKTKKESDKSSMFDKKAAKKAAIITVIVSVLVIIAILNPKIVETIFPFVIAALFTLIVWGGLYMIFEE